MGWVWNGKVGYRFQSRSCRLRETPRWPKIPGPANEPAKIERHTATHCIPYKRDDTICTILCIYIHVSCMYKCAESVSLHWRAACEIKGNNFAAHTQRIQTHQKYKAMLLFLCLLSRVCCAVRVCHARLSGTRSKLIPTGGATSLRARDNNKKTLTTCVQQPYYPRYDIQRDEPIRAARRFSPGQQPSARSTASTPARLQCTRRRAAHGRA